MKKKPMKFPQQKFKIAKGLTRPEAYRAASLRATRDFRGMLYNARTGDVILT